MSEKIPEPVNHIDAAYKYARSLGAGRYAEHVSDEIKLTVEGNPMVTEIPVHVIRSVGSTGVHITNLNLNAQGYDSHNNANLTIVRDKNIQTPDKHNSGTRYKVDTYKDWTGKASVYRKAANGEVYEHTIDTKTKSGQALADKVAELSAMEYKKAAKVRAQSILDADDL